MKFTIPIDARLLVNNVEYKGIGTGLFTQLRLASDQETVIDSGTEIGTSGVYEFEVTGNNLYLLLELWICATENGTYEKVESWGGTDGKTIESLNILDPADFNGGVPRSNGTAFSNMGIDVGTATNDMLMWNGTKWLKKTLAEAYTIISTSAYKTYKGFISQGGTSNPTFGQIYINDFSTVTASRTSTGLYTLLGISTATAKLHGYGQLFPVYDNSGDPVIGVIGYYRLGVYEGRVTISTYDIDMALADGIFGNSQLINIICNN